MFSRNRQVSAERTIEKKLPGSLEGKVNNGGNAALPMSPGNKRRLFHGMASPQSSAFSLYELSHNKIQQLIRT